MTPHPSADETGETGFPTSVRFESAPRPGPHAGQVEPRAGGRPGPLPGLLLFGFGVYLSVLYLGFRPVPTSDFCGFLKTGQELLSLHLPTSYKHAPVLGVLIVGLSRLVGGAHPELSAGWLLNSMLYPCTLVLFWLVGRKLFGQSAAFVAVVAILNPWSVGMLADPIVETTLLFFTLLTLFLISRRSKWAYLLASVTTLVRYEGAALILGALVTDLIEAGSGRHRARAVARAALASAPLGVWLAGPLLTLTAAPAGAGHYLQEMGAFSGGRFVFGEYLKLLSGVAFCPLLQLWQGSPGWAVDLLRRGVQLLAFVSLGVGTVLGLIRRERLIVAISIFLWPYLLIHAWHSFLAPRFCATVAGLTLIVTWYGATSAWRTAMPATAPRKPFRLAVHWLVLAVASVWLGMLLLSLPGVAAASPRSVSVPYVAIAVVALLLALMLATRRSGPAMGLVAGTVVACVVIVSNQFTLARVVGDGRQGIEYEALGEWFREHARPAEAIVCGNPCVVRLYAPGRAADVRALWRVSAGSPQEFVARCREQGIAYVAWDSDTGCAVGTFYYRLFGYDRIEDLREPRSSGPYQFLVQLKATDSRYVNVFRLSEPTSAAVPAVEPTGTRTPFPQ